MRIRTGYLTNNARAINSPVFNVNVLKINMKRKNRRIMKGNTRNRTRKRKIGAIEAQLKEEDEEMIGLIKVKRL
jgi:hypothetical protein